MKRIKNVLIFFLAMVMLGACRDKKSEKKEEENIQQENTFVNPLKTEGAQCWANYYDGWYYYMQEAVDRLELWRTRDITDLEHAEHKVIWIPKDPSNAHHLWGPEIHPIAGKWYVYYAASDDNMDNHQLFVLENSSADPFEGEFELKGRISTDKNNNWAIHPNVFEHRGEWYYIWAEKTGVGRQISNLYIGKMAAANKLCTDQVLLTTPDYDWERVDFWVNEGPAILKHDGKIFLTFSASATGACYCMGMMYIDENADLLDPHAWTKLRHSVLKTDEEKGIYGPGHNCFVKAEDGVTDLCVYHARPYDEIIGDPLYDPNRHARIMKVTYDEKGFPVFVYQKVEETEYL